DCAEVQIEGGAQLIGAFFAAGLVDRVQLYQAPVVLGAGPAAVGAAGAETIAAAHRLTRVAVEPLGADLLTTFVTGQAGGRDGDREEGRGPCSQAASKRSARSPRSSGSPTPPG